MENFTTSLIANTDLATRYFYFSDEKILLTDDLQLPSVNIEQANSIHLGHDQHHQYHAAIIEPAQCPAGHRLESLKEQLLHLHPELINLCLYAKHLAYWHHYYQHCVRCGGQLSLSVIERVKNCDDCQWPHYPVVSPAVIVLIHQGDDILLARSPRFPEKLFSLIAGFVEPGETLEQCVAREIKEEVGICVKNIYYKKSQPWPFPHSLMLGFYAEYDCGEIVIDGEEIIEAAWFNKNSLPERLPTRASIARGLLEDWLAMQR